MATKTINTRIKNKVAELSSWNSATGTLLDGEIAIVRVPTGDTYTNPVTGVDEPVVELLMKVGDGSSTFANLPWLSAKASDVYNWAKKGTAEEIPVTVNGTASTLGAYLTKVDTNASNISSVSAKVDVTKVSTAITNAVNALDSTSTGSGNFVKAVTQTNGKVAVTMGTIAESELPSISASKIKVDSSTTLDSKLGTMDAAIAANTSKLAGHTDAAINTLIDTKINALDVSEPSASGTSTSFIKTAKQENGKIVVTKANLPTATASAAGIAKLGANGGAATYASVFGTDGKGGINAQVNTNKADIANLKTAVAGGVHFRGTAKAAPTEATVTMSDDTTLTAAAGDVVIYDGKEYIYTGSAWEQLGDVTRIGNLETKINGLDVTTTNAVATTHKFVSQVTQTDGKVAVTYTQPTSADVSHGDGTVATKFEAVDAAIATKADSGHTHSSYVNQNAFSNIKVSKSGGGTSDVTVAADTTTDTVTFVGSNITITGDATNDKVTFSVAKADADGETGIVTLEDSVVNQSTTAATSKAVYSVNTKAEDAQTRVGAVEAKLDGVTKVTTSISDAIGALDFTDPTASGTTTSFIATVSQTDGKISATKKTITSASTSAAGIVKLSSSTSSTSEALAATPKAVKTAYDKGNDAQARVAAVEGNYVRFNSTDSKLYVGKDGADEIIFDCGGAPV
jgi:hypothetical protein